jgi:type I restriction enzyme S subunit
VWAEQEIVNGKYACMPLSDLASRIKDGPGGWGVSTNDYVASGVPVIRGVNIVHGDCDLSDCVFVSHDKHRELKSHKTVRGSVVLSVRGTIGRSAVFDVPGCDEASLNAAVVTIECRDSIHPHYLAEFFNSRVGQVQSRRIGNGAVQQNMNLTEAGSLLVVVPPPEIQLEIAHARQRRIFSHRLRRDLVLAAKFLVDGVVDRKISDNELATAQSQLEEGDCTGDRAILSRLHEGGIDSTGTRLLFPDLDAYYETLRMAEQALMDGGDE